MMFGVKSEEETSLKNSTILVISFTVCMIALCFLEVLTYFIYNRKVVPAILVYQKFALLFFPFLVSPLDKNNCWDLLCQKRRSRAIKTIDVEIVIK